VLLVPTHVQNINKFLTLNPLHCILMALKRRQHGKRKGKSCTASTSASAFAPTPAPTSATVATPASTPTSSPLWAVKIPEVIPTKLKGVENYVSWKEEVRSIIISHNLERLVVRFLIPDEYANESDRKNDILSEEYEEWLIQDQMLYSWFLSSLSDDLVPIIVRCIHSWELWHTINEHMASELKARATALRVQLNNVKKTGYLAEYLARIQTIVDSLAEAGEPVSEKEHIDTILNGLPEQYNDCATVVRGRWNPPPLHNVVSFLTVQESHMERFNILAPVECLIPANRLTAAHSIHRDIQPPPRSPDHHSALSSSPNSPNDGGRTDPRRRDPRRGGRRG